MVFIAPPPLYVFMKIFFWFTQFKFNQEGERTDQTLLNIYLEVAKYPSPCKRGYLANSLLTLMLKMHLVHFSEKVTSGLQAQIQIIFLQSLPSETSTKVYLRSCSCWHLHTSSDGQTWKWTKVYSRQTRWSSPSFSVELYLYYTHKREHKWMYI